MGSRRTNPAAGPPRAAPRGVPGPGGGFLDEVESVSRSIRDPAAKLRYLRESLARRPQLDERFARVPGSALRQALYRWASLEQLRRTLGGKAVDAKTARALLLRRAMAMLAAASVLAAVAGAVSQAFQAGTRTAAAAAPRPAPPVVAETLPSLPAGIVPRAIWLVEKGASYEQYSNGLRIDTAHAVDGPKRRYRTFRRGAGMEERVHLGPAGILFHTTESDIWPLEASYNENLRDSSQRLLRYLGRERVYHYLIDRFGRVFRVVEEDAKANHAGAGAWSDGERLYLSLNNAFLGVSFETRWEGGRALPITEAQLTSGRSLTDYLRRRYEIAPGMCVAHGLTSLNGKTHVIGHHLDWARGFPFAAFGLPDQYAGAPTNVAFFGFRHDESLSERMGEPWPGVAAGERAFALEAARAGVSVEALRNERKVLYDQWLSQQAREEEAVRAAETSAKRAKASGG